MFAKPAAYYNSKTNSLVVDAQIVLEMERYIYDGRETDCWHVKGQPPVKPFAGPLWKTNQLFISREDAIVASQAEVEKWNARRVAAGEEMVTCWECGCQAKFATARRTWERDVFGEWYCGC